MKTRRKCCRTAVAAVLCLALGGRAGAEHVVSAAEVATRLAQAEMARAADLARLEPLLERPEATAVAKAVGADLRRVRATLPHLSDAELHDLGARAAALHLDPAAGSPVNLVSGGDALLVLLIMLALIAGAVFAVAKIVD